MKKTLITLLIAASLFTACEKGVKLPEDTSEVIKVVGNDKVTENDYQKELDGINPQYRAYYKKEQIVDRLAEQKMLKQEAIKQGIDKEMEYYQELETARERILAGLIVKKNIIDKVKVSDEDIQAEYDKTKDAKYKVKAEVKASHILFGIDAKTTAKEKAELKKKAEKLLGELKGKTIVEFTEAAKKYSTGPSGKNGGDLGWFDETRMVKPFSEASFKGVKGEICPEIVETQFGYHLIFVEDKKEGGYKALEEVKEEIKNAALLPKQREVYDTWMKDLKSQYGLLEEKKEEKKEETKK